MKENKPVWGIVGSGQICHDFCLALRANNSTVAFSAASSEAKAKKFSDTHAIPQHGLFSDLLQSKEVNIVYIGTIHPSHYSQCKQLLSAGFNVLCEKPMAMNYKETEELVNLAREKKVFLAEGMWTRHFPITRKIKEVVDSGELGKPLCVTADMGFTGPDDMSHRLWDPKLGGGALLDIGCYPLSWVLLALGIEKFPQVRAVSKLRNGVDAIGSVSLLYPEAVASASYSIVSVLPETAIISFENGYIEIQNSHTPVTARIVNNSDRTTSKDTNFCFPLPSYPENHGELNFPGSEGFLYQVKEIERCIETSALETSFFTLDESLFLAKLMTEIRTQVGVQYDADN
mmetsp:Transcript_15154/g.17163  ORF Transcript_15154/g.17163 Transcript_15154/m.17163 type:complete len:344 (+) Transcript_15154:101-1132(+)|eukprot:CAMPEP_0184020450 /NCGR_PEP_ID=MMETSP0954-20121128/9356_1 /TAXON_ID=627963 /ORGANISM="Aplanochytrium sp, Strain PBS07" /LENGTH=343 /DNA_ID=CAMNT_0026302313 /DNA_START=81 /DNA_END=1112 /DNA_ORIENTATION=+